METTLHGWRADSISLYLEKIIKEEGMKTKLLILICIMALGLSACGKDDEISTNPTPTQAVSPTQGADDKKPTGGGENKPGDDGELVTWAPEEAPAVRNELTDEEKSALTFIVNDSERSYGSKGR